VSIEEPWVLSIGTGPNQAPLIGAARKLGYSIIGVDQSPNLDLIDIPIPISTYFTQDVIDELIKTGRYPRFEGVLCRSSGPAIVTSVIVSEKYSLPSAGKIIANCSVSKWDLFSWANKNGISTIPTLRCKQLFSLPENWNEVVIKPAEPVFGKKNVFLIRDSDQIESAMRKACEESLDGYAIVQPFVQGEDVGLVTLSQKGKILWSSFYQELTSLQGCTISGRGVASLRSDFDIQVKKEIKKSAEFMLNQSNACGFVFYSFRCTDSENPMLYEVNPGLCGDQLADKLLPAMWPGNDFFSLDVAVMTGHSLDFPVESPLSVKVIDGNLYAG